MNLVNIYQTIKKREVQFQTQKKKTAAKVQRNIEPSSTHNGKVRIQLNVFKAMHIRFGVFLAINVFGAITKDKRC